MGISRMVSKWGLNSDDEESVEKLLEDETRVSVSSSSSASLLNNPFTVSAEEVLNRIFAVVFFILLRRFFFFTAVGGGGGGGGKRSASEPPETDELKIFRRGVPSSWTLAITCHLSSFCHLNWGGDSVRSSSEGYCAPDLERKPQPTDVKAEDTWRLKEEERWGLEGGGVAGGKSTWWRVGDSRRNEGTGSSGRVEGSLERQDWKDGITREILSLKRFAIFSLSLSKSVNFVSEKSLVHI
ncbi:unnamed protein product [Camellia sinensis]